MSARRRSTRLAMAVSSILAAPAMVTGFGLAAGLAFAPEVLAQETSAQIAGIVVDADGAAVAGAEVKVLHVPSGTTSTAATNASGQFSLSGLRVGGPYTVTATSEGNQAAAVENVYAELGRRPALTLALVPTAQLAEVQVTAAGMQSTAVGVGTEFSAEAIASAPSIARDLKGTLRIDPKVSIDPSNQDAMSVAGNNDRYNSFTVDGVRQSDDFGLNYNGYPTQRSPISLDAVEAVSVLSAPFDVQYSGFRGATINVVTKSGTNDFHGSAFYYKFDDSLVGDKSKGQKINVGAFSEEKYGATLGGPIIQDKLFFFLSYEKFDGKTPVDYGPNGSGAATEIAGVSLNDYNCILAITTAVSETPATDTCPAHTDRYQYDPGVNLPTPTAKDEKVLGKLDWNISDTQRASLSYQHTKGNEVIQYNTGGSYLSTPSGWYNRAITMDSYSLQLFSSWSERFATELKVSRKEIETLQDGLGGNVFSNFYVRASGGGYVYIGTDVYRQANYLTNDLDQVKLKGTWFLGDHTVSLGYEREMLDIYNLFLPFSRGQYYFSSIANYAAGTASSLTYANAGTNDANDAAAKFGYNTDSLYLQDSWQVTPEFEVQGGVRFERFSSGDKPAYNQYFDERYGFSNQETLDGRDLVMPRLGFNWQVEPETMVRGGVGLFGGGTPNVWVSNSFSNDGVTVLQVFGNSTERQDVEGGGYIPQTVLDCVDADTTSTESRCVHDSTTNAIDPNFKIPSQWRYNLGIEHYFPNDWKMTADLMYSDVKNEVLWQDLRLHQIDTAPDGRPIYAQNGPPADTRALNGRDPIQDLLLTNTSQGSATIFTIDLSKSWQTRAGQVDLYVGYGHQDVIDVNPGTSSIASSNYKYVSTDDPNNPKAATSNYEIEHRFTLALNWKKAFFADAFTSAGLFVERRSGRPYSYTMTPYVYPNTTITAFGDPWYRYNRQLFYVPTVGDPLVTYSSQAVEDAVNAFIDGTALSKYRGQIAPRNAFSSPWVTTADLRLAQEIPMGVKDLRAILTLDIENVANLLNSNWGRFEQVGYPYNVSVVTADIVDGQYVYSGTVPTEVKKSMTPSQQSLWRIQLGFRIEF
jgi:outer membrane receptor for ferrienterochelin and colicin